MAVLRPLLLLTLLALLSACSSGPPVRVYPPQATVSELRLQPGGEVELSLRVQNFSTVPMTFSHLQATLTLAGQDAAHLDFDPALTVGPGSNELVRHTFSPSPAVKAALDQAFGNSRSVRYELTGNIVSSEPRSEDDFTYSSALDPVPGLPGVMR